MNIELHGFDRDVAARIRDLIFDEVVGNVPKKVASDWAFTIVHECVVDSSGSSSPFVRLLSTNQNDFKSGKKVLKNLIARIRVLQLIGFLDVECILVHEFVRIG